MQLQPTKKVSRWVIIGEEKPSEKTKKLLDLPDDWVYHIMLDFKSGKLKCDCLGFMAHGHCKHTEKYKKLLQKIIQNVLKEEKSN